MKNRLYKVVGIMTMVSQLSGLYGHTLTMKNSTDGQIVAKANYSACGPLERVIESGKTEVIDNGGCCLIDVNARSTSGGAAGTMTKHIPHSTGAGISCQSNQVTFTQTADKKELVALRGIDTAATKGITNFHLQNMTDSQLTITLYYKSAECTQETQMVNAGQTLHLQIGLCCLLSVKIKANGGAANGKERILNPVGGPSGCGTLVTHYVKTDASGNIVVDSR